MTDQNIAIRLKFLIDYLGISSSQFADACNISRPTLSQLITGRNKKVSDVIIGQIHEAYPNLSILWLLFGEGEMWLGQPSLNGNSSEPLSPDSNIINTDSEDPNGSSHVSTPQTGDLCEKIPCENPEFPKDGHAEMKYGKENALNYTENGGQSTINKDVNTYIKNAELLSDLAKLKEKTRKVVQVTIYYDDSTFESFYPGK